MDVDADAAKPLYDREGERETKRRLNARCAAAVGCVRKLCSDLWHTAMGALHEWHSTIHRRAHIHLPFANIHIEFIFMEYEYVINSNGELLLWICY